jgi:cytochrome c-type biogenesis protein
MPANLISFTLAFMAGVYTLFSPCTYPMLPSYIIYYMNSKNSKSSIKKALSGSALCTFSFILVFAIIGAITSILRNLILSYIPLLLLVAAFLIILMGIVSLKKVNFLSFNIPVTPSKHNGFSGFFIFGLAYGLAAVGCSAPIFFSVFLYAIFTGGVLNALVTFLVYALSMGITLTMLSVLLVKIRAMVLKKIIMAMPWLQKMGGTTLLIAGFYLIYFYYSAYIISIP